MKRLIKKTISKLGYRLITNNNYNKLLSKKETLSYKNNLLHSFYTILSEQGFKPQVIYDIGANKGTWTQECLKYFPAAKFYLFEPQISLKPYCDKIIEKNKNVELFSVGVGNEEGVLNFTIVERDDSCNFRYTEEEAKKAGYNQIKVPIIKLDKFIQENKLQPPTLLKIDAEGLDIEVLLGAENTLKNIEIVMVEAAIMCDSLSNTVVKTINFLDDKGFRLFDITDMNRPFSNNVLWLSEFVFIKKGGELDKDYSL